MPAKDECVPSIRFAILDNDPITIIGLTEIVESLRMGTVIWTQTDANEAVRLATGADMKPDMLLVDMSLGESRNALSGTDVCRRVRERTDAVAILAVTSFPLHIYEREAAIAGAQGIVSKADRDTLRSAIRTVACGGTWGERFEGTITAHVRVKNHPRSPRQLLSMREQEALDLKAQGLTNKQIAQRLECKEPTVNSLMARAKAKLHVRTAAEAAAVWTGERAA